MVLLATLFDAGVGFFHLVFWRLFGWSRRLPRSGPINAAITQTLNVVLTYVLLAYAAALAYASRTGGDTSLLLWAGAGFWLLRAGLQPTLFPLRMTLNAPITGVWLLGAGLHAVAGGRGLAFAG
jgi:hypothetical protein